MRKRIPHRINEVTGAEEKYCKRCGNWVELAKFNHKKASWDGLETCCADCKKEASKKFRQDKPNYDKEYQAKNKDKLRKYKREYYKKKQQESDQSS